MFLIALNRLREDLLDKLKSKSSEINFIVGRIEKIIASFKEAGVYVLEKGELENYYSQSIKNPFNVSDKEKIKLFNDEKDYLLQNNPTEDEIKKRYDGIINILDKATSGTKVDYRSLLLRHVRKFVYDLQDAFNFGELNGDASQILQNEKFVSYSKILNIENFSKSDSAFSCTIKLRGFDDFNNVSIDFDEKTNPSTVTF